MTDPTPALRAENLTRVFHGRAGDVTACSAPFLAVHAGELLVVRGPSGSGKTTLLNLLGGLDSPTTGSVWIGDRDLTTLTETERVALRRAELGYVFQGFGLIPVFSAAENIEVPLRILGMDARERDARVTELLELVGLGDHGRQRPYELSGGQQQRVGLARALAARPRILLADEPTGQLDSGTAATIMALIARLVHEEGIAAIVTTHDPLLMELADTLVEIHNGELGDAVHRAGHGRHAAV